MTDAILTFLSKCHETQDLDTILTVTGLPRLRVETALIEYQDADAVFMKNGRYWLSEAKRREMAA